MKLFPIAILAFATASGTAFAQEEHDHASHGGAGHHEGMPVQENTTNSENSERVGDPWPLSRCPVSGQELGAMGDPVIRLHDSREIRFCCQGCVATFDAEPERYLSEADVQIRQQQESLYPLDHCIIDVEEAIEDDPAENHYSIVGNRLFIYCCPPCDEDVQADPQRYIGILNQAVIGRQTAEYPLNTCVVSGDPLGGEPVLHVSNGQLLKLCCAACIETFERNPSEYLGRLAASHGDSGSQ